MKSLPPPVTAASLMPEWIALVREIARREGHAVRAGAGNTIEVQSINTGVFHPIAMPTGATEFTTAAERDFVLEKITRP
ncbi:hypothetical protein K0B96_06470 [Horticoccus luteus]|uniref:Uncharacterized protein n=1 Tax=Horticoccus luteus TaxID=2862869 RepID=A0A8F9TYU8_9BACT|nr:hypothetical protein [Horticoccus luteus]QYM80253.1 hypothetical protein K0B96_06470 [Horticoccus luteus]